MFTSVCKRKLAALCDFGQMSGTLCDGADDTQMYVCIVRLDAIRAFFHCVHFLIHDFVDHRKTQGSWITGSSVIQNDSANQMEMIAKERWCSLHESFLRLL